MKIISIMKFFYMESPLGQAEVEVEGLGKLQVKDCLSLATINAMTSDVQKHVQKLLEAAK